MKFEEGDRVKHRRLPEYGIGHVDDTSIEKSAQSVGVVWENGSHSWSLTANLERAAGGNGR